MGKNKSDRCYACNGPATTREHAPPKSFYPDHLRNNLLVVPSCSIHNNGNAKDVEYIGILLASEFRASKLAADSIHPKIARAFDRTPALLPTAFRDLQPLTFEGTQTAAFKLDITRFNSIMEAMANALFFYYYKRHFLGRWVVFSPSTYDQEELAGRPGKYHELRSVLGRLELSELKTPHPEVFACRVNFESYHELVFEFQFYEGIKVYTISIPFWKVFPKGRTK